MYVTGKKIQDTKGSVDFRGIDHIINWNEVSSIKLLRASYSKIVLRNGKYFSQMFRTYS